MSFDWNLSSDEENDFDDWDQSDWKKESSAAPSSLISSAASRPGIVHEDEDEDSSSSDEESITRNSSSFGGVAFSNHVFHEKYEEEEEEDDDDDDDDDVDWEDAAATEGKHTPLVINETPELAADTNATLSVATLRPVTLDYTAKDETESPSKKPRQKVARKRYRFEQLTPDLQFLLSNLEKAHLLSLTAHAIYASYQCSQDNALNVAHSLIPLAWVRAPTLAPTIEELRSFCNFFFHLVHPWRHQTAETVALRPRYRKQSQNVKATRKGKSKSDDESPSGAPLPFDITGPVQYRIPEYCAFLAERAATPPHRAPPPHNYRNHDHVQLFIAMARSMGWRVRYVLVLDPCQRDLHVDHPLLVSMSTRNVFQRLWKQSRKDLDGDQKRPAKRRKSESGKGKKSSPPTPGVKPTEEALETFLGFFQYTAAKSELPVCWVEILCQGSDGKRNIRDKNSKLRWVHLDPTRELIDTPEAMETILYAVQEGIPCSKSKKKRPIPYALAAEHIAMTGDASLKLRLADVTPRYSSSFVESLKVRGVIRGKQGPISDADRTDKWFTNTLKSVNVASHVHQRELKAMGGTQANAIAVDLEIYDEDKKPAAVGDFHLTEVDKHEEQQLQQLRLDEPIPKSKTAFKTNPVYTLPSLLNANEVLKPDAKKRMCGVFKGEFVFRRSDVETALPASKWLYKGRKVKESELKKPIKRVKARNRGTSKSFKALKSYGVGESNDGSEKTRGKILDAASQPLDDGMENLYASWQTNPWAPDPVGQGDPIPVNDHNNIELALLNPGLVHIDERHISKVAKKLGIPYAPCLLGFEGHNGNRTPTIRGIVVHEHNEELLREAHEEMASHFLQEEHENKQRAILLRWKRLMVGVLTKERLDRAYG